MFCSQCGNNVTPGSAFCQACGTAVTASSATAAALPPSGTLPVPAASDSVSPHWLPPATRAYGGFWLRLVAHLVDSVLLGIVFLVLLVPVFLLTGLGELLHSINRQGQPDPAAVFAFASSLALLAAVGVLGNWLYNAYFESSDWQGTVGKKVLNLIVTDLEGNRISFGRASGRFFAKLISALIPLGIGYILAGLTEKKQTLHDMIAGCLVLRS